MNINLFLELSKHSFYLTKEYLQIDSILKKNVSFLDEGLTLPEGVPHLVPFIAVQVLHGDSEFFVFLNLLFVECSQFVLGEDSDAVVDESGHVPTAQ